jgi:phospholipid-binding lipoprotein MlaA
MDFNGSPTRRVKPVAARYELLGLNLVSKRAQYLGLGDELNDLALDRYSFLRDVYLQKRLSDVWDGNPPEDSEEGDMQGQPGALAPDVEGLPAQAARALDPSTGEKSP